MLLAHCDWAAWPASCRAALAQRAPQLPRAELAGVHALALQPSAETAELAARLLAQGASADAVTVAYTHADGYAVKDQTALHLLAAGGRYRWESANGVIKRYPRVLLQHGRVMFTRVNHVAPEDARAFASVLRRHHANLRLRDAGANFITHLACDSVRVRARVGVRVRVRLGLGLG